MPGCDRLPGRDRLKATNTGIIALNPAALELICWLHQIF
jgi:hypothetical protein